MSLANNIFYFFDCIVWIMVSAFMGRFSADRTFFHGKEGKLGVLIVNLGTPKRADAKAVRQFLAQFLSDRRVVEIPRLIWLAILYGIILPKRSGVVAKNYRKIWMGEIESSASPLMVYSKRQKEALQQSLQQHLHSSAHVELAMCYGEPSLTQALDALREKGMRHLLVLPLYPQYSATTSGAVFDALTGVLQRWRWLPELRWVNSYHDEATYIQALMHSVQDHWSAREEDGDTKKRVLVMSFHGLPERSLELGDPYFCQCHKTARLLAEALDLEDNAWQVTFQSRFGRAEWLKPYTDDALEKLAHSGVEHVDVICPGFAADCLETLEEINMESRDVFLKAGGQSYHYIPALNDQDKHIEALTQIVLQNTQGWSEINLEEENALKKSNALMLERAKLLGAKY